MRVYIRVCLWSVWVTFLIFWAEFYLKLTKVLDNISFYFSIFFSQNNFNFYWHSIVNFTHIILSNSLEITISAAKNGISSQKKWKIGFKDISCQIILLYLALKPTQFPLKKCLFHLSQTSITRKIHQKTKNHYFHSMIPIKILQKSA